MNTLVYDVSGIRERKEGGGVSKVKLDRHGRFTHLFWMTAGQVGEELCARG